MLFINHFASDLPGVTDHYAESDEHALAITKRIVSNLNYEKVPQGALVVLTYIRTVMICSEFTPTVTLREPVEPLFPPEEIYGIIPKDTMKGVDIRLVQPTCIKAGNYAKLIR